MSVSEKVAYLRGLMEGLDIDGDKKEGKMFAAIIDALDEIASDLSDIDEDLEGWRSYMPIYPENWYNGFDPDLAIRSEKLYNVRAIPSLYLLDENKKVLFKDVPEQTLFRVLGI